VHAAVPFLRPLGVTRLREFLFEFRSLLSADDTMHQIMKRVPGNAPQLSQGFPHTPPSPSTISPSETPPMRHPRGTTAPRHLKNFFLHTLKLPFPFFSQSSSIFSPYKVQTKFIFHLVL